MEDVMQVLTSMLIGNSLVAMGLALAALFFASWRRPAIAHAIWILVLVKLVTPAMVRVPVLESAKPQVTAEVAAAVTMDEVVPAEANDFHVGASRVSASRNLNAWIPGGLSAVWAAGSVLITIISASRIARFRRLLAMADDAPIELLAQIEPIAARLNVAMPRVRILPDAMPMVFGFGRGATLVLPTSIVAHLNASQRETIIAHELAHLRRGDPWVRLLEMFVTIAMWWHPLVWLARWGVRAAEEQCCDAWVVDTLPDSRKTYAGALVDTMAIFSNVAPRYAPTASGLGHIRDLRKRLTMIMTYHPRKNLSIVGMALVAALVLTLPIVPAAAEQQDSKNDGTSFVKQVEDKAPAADEKDKARDDAELKELRERVKKLEEKLAEQTDTDKATDAQRKSLAAKARQRMSQDSKKYSRDEIRAAENLYQVANDRRNWRQPAAIDSLKKMIETYPDLNRTGCAILYLGQMSEGEEQEKYWKQAIEKFSDCWYGNGVQVGALGRLFLGGYYRQNGKTEEGDKLWDEVLKDYPGSIDHSGRLLSKIIEEARKEATSQPSK